MYSQTDGTLSSRSGQAVCEHNAQRQETGPFFTARTRRHSAGQAPEHRLGPVHFHICAGTGQLVLSHPNTLLFWDAALPAGGCGTTRRCHRPDNLCISALICACTILHALRSAHKKKKRRGPMERSQMTCPWLCAFEPKAVVVFNVLHDVDIFLGLACCVGSFLLPLWNIVYSAMPCVQRPICGVAVYASHSGQGFTAPLGGAARNPTRPSLGQRASVDQLSGQSSTSFPVWRAHSHVFIVMTLEGCFCECVNLIVSLDLLPFLGRGCLVKCSMRPDPLDLFHVGLVRVSIGRQQTPCIHLAGCQLFLEREVPRMVHR